MICESSTFHVVRTGRTMFSSVMMMSIYFHEIKRTDSILSDGYATSKRF